MGQVGRSSMPPISIRPATVSELQNALNDRPALADAIGCQVPDGWPEKDEMFRFAAERLKEHPEEAEWRGLLVLRRSRSPHGGGRVGDGGVLVAGRGGAGGGRSKNADLGAGVGAVVGVGGVWAAAHGQQCAADREGGQHGDHGESCGDFLVVARRAGRVLLARGSGLSGLGRGCGDGAGVCGRCGIGVIGRVRGISAAVSRIRLGAVLIEIDWGSVDVGWPVIVVGDAVIEFVIVAVCCAEARWWRCVAVFDSGNVAEIDCSAVEVGTSLATVKVVKPR